MLFVCTRERFVLHAFPCPPHSQLAASPPLRMFARDRCVSGWLHPQIMEELHGLGPMGYEAAGNAEYLRAVIHETLRCVLWKCMSVVEGVWLGLRGVCVEYLVGSVC